MKASELRDLTVDDLKGKEVEFKKDLFNLRMQHSMGQAENPLRIRFLKRDIARVKTLIVEKQRGSL